VLTYSLGDAGQVVNSLIPSQVSPQAELVNLLALVEEIDPPCPAPPYNQSL
jgi:hypothetical protein